MLLVHAGGYSKRLPNVSVIGKIFAAVPHGKRGILVESRLVYNTTPHAWFPGQPVFQMLEEKLAMYLPCLPTMAAGVSCWIWSCIL